MADKRDKVKIGIIGLGRMGSIYADCLARRTAGAELVAVADIRPELAEKTARTYGLPRWYSDFREMLEIERFGHAYQAQIQHFVDCLQEGCEPSVGGVDGRLWKSA